MCACVEMGLLDAADVEFLHFEELLSCPFCIPVHDAKCLMIGSSTVLALLSEEDQNRSQSHWLGPF